MGGMNGSSTGLPGCSGVVAREIWRCGGETGLCVEVGLEFCVNGNGAWV